MITYTSVSMVVSMATSVYLADMMHTPHMVKDLFCSLLREACIRYVYAWT